MDTGTQEELAIFRKYDSDEDDDEVAEEKVAEEQKNETAPCNQAPTQHAAEAAARRSADCCSAWINSPSLRGHVDLLGVSWET